jgi:hypothetical protein
VARKTSEAEAEFATPAEAADYIREIADALARIAERADLEPLAYILKMAAMEAAAHASPKPRRSDSANPA